MLLLDSTGQTKSGTHWPESLDLKPGEQVSLVHRTSWKVDAAAQYKATLYVTSSRSARVEWKLSPAYAGAAATKELIKRGTYQPLKAVRGKPTIDIGGRCSAKSTDRSAQLELPRLQLASYVMISAPRLIPASCESNCGDSTYCIDCRTEAVVACNPWHIKYFHCDCVSCSCTWSCAP